MSRKKPFTPIHIGQMADALGEISDRAMLLISAIRTAHELAEVVDAAQLRKLIAAAKEQANSLSEALWGDDA